MLLTPAAVKSLPTVVDLLSNPFFAEVPVTVSSKCSFKASARGKEALKATWTAYEAAIHGEQKFVSMGMPFLPPSALLQECCIRRDRCAAHRTA